MSGHEVFLREYLSILFTKAADTLDLLEAEIKRQDDTAEFSTELDELRTRCQNRARDFRQTKLEVRSDDGTGD